MAAKEVPDSELWPDVLAVAKAGSVHAASKVIGQPRNTLTSRLAMAKIRWPSVFENCYSAGRQGSKMSLPKDLPKKAPPRENGTPSGGVVPPEQRDREAILRRRADEDRKDIVDQLERATQRIIGLEDQIATVMRLKEKQLPHVRWAPGKISARRQRTTLMPILFTSDFQVGEVIRADELDGINAYDMNIFAARYNTLIETSIDISDHHTGPAEYPGIIYLRGGDAISGGIHDELRETDDLSAVPAGKWLLQHEREGIRRLRERFGSVHVISIPGNHGRTTFKPRSKGYTRLNYETMLTWWLQSMFESDPKVTFETPVSGDAWFNVFGWNFLLAHGDRMGSRGGAGFIGPAATVARGHFRLFKNWAITGRIPNFILTGHLHTSLKLELGYGNGSLPGFNEYARDLGFTPSAPTQWLLYVHERRGISHGFEVQLADPPKRVS
jgi:hypothetical protein